MACSNALIENKALKRIFGETYRSCLLLSLPSVPGLIKRPDGHLYLITYNGNCLGIREVNLIQVFNNGNHTYREKQSRKVHFWTSR